MSFLCLIVSIIFMWFFNKTLFILSSIILTGRGSSVGICGLGLGQVPNVHFVH